MKYSNTVAVLVDSKEHENKTGALLERTRIFGSEERARVYLSRVKNLPQDASVYLMTRISRGYFSYGHTK